MSTWSEHWTGLAVAPPSARPFWGALGWWLLALAALVPVLAAMQHYPQYMIWMALAVPAFGLATLAVLYRPAWGACALILLAYWNASDVISATFGFSWLLRLAIAGVLAAGLLTWLLESPPRRLRWPLLGPLLLWGGAQVICTATAISPGIAAAQLLEYVKVLLVFYLVVNLLPSPRWWRWGVDALLAAVSLLSLPVVYQGLTGSHFAFWGFGTMEYSATAPGQFGWRLGGAMGDPNFLAMVLVAALPLAAYQALEPSAHWFRRLWALGVAGLALAAMLFTYSRGAFLGLGLLVVVLLVAHPQRKWVLTAAVAGVLLASALAPQQLWSRLATLVQNSLGAQEQQMTDSSFRSRRHEMLTGLDMFLHHPLVGVGPGNFETAYLKYSAQVGLSGDNTVRDPHSLYTQLLAETGLVGLAAFAFLLISAFRLLERGRKRAHRLGAATFGRLLAACELVLAVYLTCSVFLHDAYFRHFFLLLALGVLGAALALDRQPRRQPAPVASNPEPIQGGI